MMMVTHVKRGALGNQYVLRSLSIESTQFKEQWSFDDLCIIGGFLWHVQITNWQWHFEKVLKHQVHQIMY